MVSENTRTMALCYAFEGNCPLPVQSCKSSILKPRDINSRSFQCDDYNLEEQNYNTFLGTCPVLRSHNLDFVPRQSYGLPTYSTTSTTLSSSTRER